MSIENARAFWQTKEETETEKKNHSRRNERAKCDGYFPYWVLTVLLILLTTVADAAVATIAVICK